MTIVTNFRAEGFSDPEIDAPPTAIQNNTPITPAPGLPDNHPVLTTTYDSLDDLEAILRQFGVSNGIAFSKKNGKGY